MRLALIQATHVGTVFGASLALESASDPPRFSRQTEYNGRHAVCRGTRQDLESIHPPTLHFALHGVSTLSLSSNASEISQWQWMNPATTTKSEFFLSTYGGICRGPGCIGIPEWRGWSSRGRNRSGKLELFTSSSRYFCPVFHYMESDVKGKNARSASF